MSLPRALSSRRRLEMCLADQGLPEVPRLGRYNHTRAEPGIPEHEHGDILEICFLVKGRQTYRVGGRDYHLRGGDVFVAFPHERHGSAGNPEEKGVLYWMMLRKTRRGLFGFPSVESKTLWHSLCGLSSRHFRGSWKMKVHLNELTTLFNGPDFPLRPISLASEALAFLLEVLKCAGRDVAPQTSTQKINAIQRYIREHLDEPLSVPGLAGISGLSIPRFQARFKEETGVPPGEYVLRTRIEEARRRLATGRVSVTQVAYALEFSSSQYFATVFKRYTGKTPSAAMRQTATANSGISLRQPSA